VALHLQICERAIAVDTERGRAELSAARAAISEAITRLRQQVFALRPTMLDEAGLSATLRRYVALQPSNPDRSIELVDRLGEQRLDPRTALGLFRIAQAALDNAVARANARQVAVELAAAGDGVQLTVRDDGAGFDATTALAEAGRSGAAGGLTTVQDWCEALGALLDLQSGPDGTTLTIRLRPR
jgi:signal transduction histidine kinase